MTAMARGDHSADQGPWAGPPAIGGILWGDRSRWYNRARPLLWMLFLAAPLSNVYSAHRAVSPVHAAVVYTAAGFFIVTFLALNLYYESRRGFPRWFWGLIALWLISIVTFLSYYDAGYWAYAYIFCLFPTIRFTYKGPQTVLGLTALTAVVTSTAGLTSGNIWGPVATVGGGGMAAVAFWRLTTTNQELRKARDDLARVAVADERLRFARDLHDLLGHSLSVITLKSEVAGRLLSDSPERARTEVAEIEAIAREALREVREAVTGYRQATVAVEVAGARTALAAAGIAWSEDIQIPGLVPETEAPLAWAVREGVTNVIRHSGARHCRLTIRPEGDYYVATVTDDGEVEAGDVTEGNAGPIGNGLRGLSERLALVGGALEAGPVPGGGFRLRAAVPRSAAAVLHEADPALSAAEPVGEAEPAGTTERAAAAEPPGAAEPAPAGVVEPVPEGVVEPAPAGAGYDRR
jgi:two-component system, NarL family, sensor histidine kinase DesK